MQHDCRIFSCKDASSPGSTPLSRSSVRVNSQATRDIRSCAAWSHPNFYFFSPLCQTESHLSPLTENKWTFAIMRSMLSGLSTLCTPLNAALSHTPHPGSRCARLPHQWAELPACLSQADRGRIGRLSTSWNTLLFLFPISHMHLDIPYFKFAHFCLYFVDSFTSICWQVCNFGLLCLPWICVDRTVLLCFSLRGV